MRLTPGTVAVILLALGACTSRTPPPSKAAAKPETAVQAPAPQPTPPTTLHGTHTVARVDGYDVHVIAPTKLHTDAQHPWVWIFPMNFFLDLAPNVGSDSERYGNSLLDAGFYLIGVGAEGRGSPASMALFEHAYTHVTTTYGLAPQARMFVASRGALDAIGYLSRHPDHADRIAGIYPAVDWFDWPGRDGLPHQNVDVPLGFTDGDRANLDALNPINSLAPLASHGVRLLLMHGLKDNTVHIGPNAQTVVKRYRALGGAVSLMTIPKMGHDNSGTFRPEMISFLTTKSFAGKK